MHILISKMGENNAVVASQKRLAALLGCHVNTIIRAVRDLEADRWIEVRQVGGTGTVNAYVINDRVAWHGPRQGIRHSWFSATVLLSDDEQPDRAVLDELPPLRKFPRVYPDEKQLPSGEGLPPPSSPALPGLEVDLPATATPERRGEPVTIGALVGRLVQDREPSE
jgi:DNA-binding transcriptional MocR family regulator